MSYQLFWNYLDLPAPAFLTSKLVCNSPNKVVTELKLLMSSIKKTMNDLKQLDLEAAALSRFIYRAKSKMRQEKSLKALQKINRCLTNYLTLNLPFVLNSIHDTLVDDFGPTRQMVEWALVRLLGVAHLFNKVYHLCIDAAGHLFVKIKLGHILELSVFAIAVISRIWTFAQFIVKRVTEWYYKLYQYLEVLHPSPVPWLPSGVLLPPDVGRTLDNAHYIKLQHIQKPSKLLHNIGISDDDRKQLTRNIIELTEIDDLGESISREMLKEELEESQDNSVQSQAQKDQPVATKVTKQPGGKQSKDKHSVNNILSGKDLVKFLKIESESRNNPSNGKKNKQSCLFSHLDKLQWKIVHSFLKTQIIAIKKATIENNLKSQDKLLKGAREYIINFIR